MGSKVTQAQLREYQAISNTFFEMSRELSMRGVVFGVEEGPLRLDFQNAAQAGEWSEAMLVPSQSRLTDSIEELAAVGPETSTFQYLTVLRRVKRAALDEFHLHYGHATSVQASSIVEAAKFRINLELGLAWLMLNQCFPARRSGAWAAKRIAKLLECL